MQYKLRNGITRYDGITLNEFLKNNKEMKYDSLQFVRGHLNDSHNQGDEYHFTFGLNYEKVVVSVFCENSHSRGTDRYNTIMTEMGRILMVDDLVQERFTQQENVEFKGQSKQEIADVRGRLFERYETQAQWRLVTVDYKN